jgi:hypothetical protein
LLKGGLSPTAPSSVDSTCSWSGTWDFDWSNALKLTQSGNSVTGSYKPSGWNYTGYIEGTASGNTLSGTWTEQDDNGKLEWTLSPGCNSFTGRYTHSLSSNSGWYPLHRPGTRVSQPSPGNNQPVPPPVNTSWDGAWKTDWGDMQISSTGPNASGTYSTGNGRLTGIINGNVFSGTWSKSPSYAAPNDAGSFLFTMSSDGLTFKGDWKYSVCPWSANWNGVLKGSAQPMPNPNPNPNPFPDPIPNPNPNPNPNPIPTPPAPNPNPSPAPGTNHAPVASFYFSPQLPKSGDVVAFVSQSADQDGDVLSYTWIRDGATITEWANLPSVNWVSPPAGTHTVTLVVNDNRGQTASFQSQINITLGPPSPTPIPPSPLPPTPNPPSPTPAPTPAYNNTPKALFTLDPPQPKANESVQVSSQSTDADNDRLTCTWSLDGQALVQYSGQSNWKWKAPASGLHILTLVVNDSKGGSDTLSRKIKISGGIGPDGQKPKWKIGPFSCFIATAAYGSETAHELDLLRAFRDRVLMQSAPGRMFVDIYYRLSPPLAEFIADHEEVRTGVREWMLDPIVYTLKHTQPCWDKACTPVQ